MLISNDQVIILGAALFYIVMIVLAGLFFRADKDVKITKLGIWNAHLYLRRPGQIMAYVGVIPLAAALVLIIMNLGR